MDIYRTNHNSIYTQSKKYPVLRVEIMLSDKDTEEAAEQKLLEQLQKAEAEYEQNMNFMPDEEGNLVEVQKDKPTLSTIKRWIREYRNQLLRESDFAVLPDVQTNKSAWQTYRQRLRDLPATWKLDTDNPEVDLSQIYTYNDVVTLPFPNPPK
jgi:dihydroorotate dehydrogenase